MLCEGLCAAEHAAPAGPPARSRAALLLPVGLGKLHLFHPVVPSVLEAPWACGRAGVLRKLVSAAGSAAGSFLRLGKIWASQSTAAAPRRCPFAGFRVWDSRSRRPAARMGRSSTF